MAKEERIGNTRKSERRGNNDERIVEQSSVGDYWHSRKISATI